jgi:hypothetical protein
MYIISSEQANAPYLVTASAMNGVQVVHWGSRSQCERYIKQRAKHGFATHFLYVVKNTERAITLLKNRLRI